MTRLLTAAALLALPLLAAAAVLAAWDPQAFSKEDTLEYLTVGPEEGEHWSTVWLVVIDGQVYIRLGSRAAERMEKNTTKPYVKVRIAGQEFDRVKAEAGARHGRAGRQGDGRKVHQRRPGQVLQSPADDAPDPVGARHAVPSRRDADSRGSRRQPVTTPRAYPEPLVDHVAQRPPLQVALEVVLEDRQHAIEVRRRVPRDVRREHQIGQRPERVLRAAAAPR